MKMRTFRMTAPAVTVRLSGIAWELQSPQKGSQDARTTADYARAVKMFAPAANAAR